MAIFPRAKSFGFVLGLATTVFIALTGSEAFAQSARVKAACSGDYGRFCPSYPVGSSQLRQCMRANGKSLSRDCVDALADEGEIKRSDSKSRRR